MPSHDSNRHKMVFFEPGDSNLSSSKVTLARRHQNARTGSDAKEDTNKRYNFSRMFAGRPIRLLVMVAVFALTSGWACGLCDAMPDSPQSLLPDTALRFTYVDSHDSQDDRSLDQHNTVQVRASDDEILVAEKVFAQVPELDKEHVHIKDRVAVATKLQRMMDDAHHKLQVVADFDRTLSKYAHEGQVCSTTHGVLEDSVHMSAEFKVQAKKLKDTYLPIEFDGTKTIAEKIPHMIEWWTKGHALIAGAQLTQDLLRTIVQESSAHLRDGCTWFFDELHKHEIPLLIFSAGLGDIITEVVKHQAKLQDNMKIVSNFLQFDQEGKVVDFAGDMIHVYNKNENAIHSSDYFQNIRHRQNLLLLGDSLGDLRMAEGAGDVHCMLKIGFLNYKVDENLAQYKESYDIVVVQDQTMDIVNAVMAKILPPS